MVTMKTDIQVFPDLSALSAAAALLFVTTATQSVRERGQFLVAFSGGSTSMPLYRLLARELIDWTRVHIFWGDERLVPADDPENNYGQAREILLKHIPIPSENIHRIASELEPEQSALDYAHMLKAFATAPLDWPCFDLVLLGMGEDGHTASLFPGSPVEMSEPVIAVTADYQGRPAQRVSLTPLVFNTARQVIFLVTGANKAATLNNVISGYNNFPEQYPAQRIRLTDGQVTWLVDEAAGQKLHREEKTPRTKNKS
jgi:6-phosphogluconolactonase